MLKQNSVLEVKVGENLYQLYVPSHASLGELHDVLYQMRSYVVSRINEGLQQDASQIEKVKEAEIEVING